MNVRTLTIAVALALAGTTSAFADQNHNATGGGGTGSHGNSNAVGRPNAVQANQQTQASFDASRAASSASTTPVHNDPCLGDNPSARSWGIGADMSQGM